MKHRSSIRPLVTSILLALAIQAGASISGPYAPDADTLNLWHLDESSSPVLNSVSGGQAMQGLLNNATLGNTSFGGFGTALNTFTSSGGTANSGTWQGGLLLAQPALANGAGDNVPNTFPYAGAGGAFTYEAIIKLDSALTIGSAPANNWMQIIAMDDEGAASRVFQFRLQDTTTPALSFLPFNASGVSAQTDLQLAVPLTGFHALAVDTWFHVAVAYNGDQGVAGNMSLYWTKLDASVTEANLLGTVTMNADLNGTFGDFAFGNEARSAGESENFAGMIDEVRMSGVARSANQFIFVPEPSSAALAGLGTLLLAGRRRRA
jgi:hypothetical protein